MGEVPLHLRPTPWAKGPLQMGRLGVHTRWHCLLITELFQEASRLLPNPCHFQDYDRHVILRSAWFRGMLPEVDVDRLELLVL